MNPFTIFIIILIILAGILVLANRWLQKRFQIEPTSGWIYKPVSKAHRITETVLIIAFLMSLFFTRDHVPFLLLAYLLLASLLRAFFEWRNQREAGRYILSLSNVAFYAALTLMLFLFHQYLP
ncbi:MAG: DUF4181 domain-containing protein [Sporolactobacillus sp.]